MGVATVTDSSGGTASGNTSVSVVNRSPQLSSPSLSDSTPEASDTVTCSASATDADGESVSVSYEWTRSGVVMGSTSSLSLTPSTYSVGDVLVCEVSTADGYGGTDTDTAFATVGNTVPTISGAQISPTTNVTTSSLLSCSASATDTNDGTLSVSYAWSASGGSSSSGATWQLTPSAVGR